MKESKRSAETKKARRRDWILRFCAECDEKTRSVKIQVEKIIKRRKDEREHSAV